jgi:hypothetical protein
MFVVVFSPVVYICTPLAKLARHKDVVTQRQRNFGDEAM